MTTDPVLLFVTFVPRDGAEDAALEVLKSMVAPSRAEPGNERYELCESELDGSRRLHLIERYKDETAVESHRGTAHYHTYRAAIGQLLAAPIDVVRMRPIA